MDEIWERAVEMALDGQTDVDLVRTLTLDGAVKCVHGRLPPPSLFEKFHNLQHLSMANIGASSLEQFPRLRNLQKLILSDNRIAGGLEFLVAAGPESLRDLDLSNNRISDINDLRPLAELRLVSLDLYECPVTRIKDYRSRVFGLIRSLKYLDKMDAEENERPESDDEDDDDDEEEDDDPGSGEIDGGDNPFRLSNGQIAGSDGVVDVDEDEESDADEEEAETSRAINGLSHAGSSHNRTNGFRVDVVDGEDDEEEGDDEDDSAEEVFEDDEGDDEDVVEVHEIDDSDDGEDGVEDEDEDDDDEDGEEEEVDNDYRDLREAESTDRLTSTEGEIDGHEQGEDDADEDDDGETGEEEQAVEEDGEYEDEEEADDEEDDCGSAGYLFQPVERVEAEDNGGGGEGEDLELEEDVEDEDDEDGEVQELPAASSSHKRKRNGDSDDDGDDGEEEEEDMVQPSSKQR
ncbi:acidic leucine-rich nuclear phosphoprotein 32-related protein-like [Salvia splendens]|nr:acidic leucine-rich nuclear phosphoprotein 32-related protein-like [Salvia splendens]